MSDLRCKLTLKDGQVFRFLLEKGQGVEFVAMIGEIGYRHNDGTFYLTSTIHQVEMENPDMDDDPPERVHELN